jgi:Domain of unknown function (DUF4262)
MSDFARDDLSRDARLARTRERIWAVGYDVRSHPAKGQRPGYAHTIGLTVHGYPELIVFGLTEGQAHRVLDDFSRRKRRSQLRSGICEHTFDGKTVALIEVSQGRAAGFIRLPAPLFAQEQLIGGLQIVWPDEAGRFPWQPECGISARVQPLLGSPPPTEPPMICGGVIND